jgi:hypothetical protein
MFCSSSPLYNYAKKQNPQLALPKKVLLNFSLHPYTANEFSVSSMTLSNIIDIRFCDYKSRFPELLKRRIKLFQITNLISKNKRGKV